MGLGGDRNHGGADMAQVRTWAAFDVHVSGVLAATLERDSGELRVQRLAGGSDRSGGARPSQRDVELVPRAHPELPEHLVQVVLDRARGQEQPFADLRVREAVACQAGDLGLP
jgi:hypothetical protein